MLTISKAEKQRGFMSLVLLFAIVLGSIYFIAGMIEDNQAEQKRYDENKIPSEGFYINDEPVTRQNAIPRTLEILSESEMRANTIDNFDN